MQSDHKNLKSLVNNGKLDQTRLEAEFSKLKEEYQKLDIESTKLNNQCEVSLEDVIFHSLCIVTSHRLLFSKVSMLLDLCALLWCILLIFFCFPH